MEDDAKVQKAWIDWINAQYTLADTPLLQPVSNRRAVDGGERQVDLPLGAAELTHPRRGATGLSAESRRRE